MDADTFPFNAHKTQLRDICLPVLRAGADFAGIELRFARLIDLADRHLISCAGTSDHGDLPRRMGESFAALDRPSTGADLLRNCLEAWLKSLLHRVNAVAYSALRGDKNFNLYRTLLELQLLSQAELELKAERIATISDPVRRHLALAKDERNAPTHGAPAIDEYSVQLRAAVVAILASVDKHRESLQRTLNALIVRPLAADQIGNIRRVRAERERRLIRFVGRRKLLSQVGEALAERTSEGGYILITAPEGFGKSALASRLTEDNDSPSERLGPASQVVQRDAPWLPNVLLHMGKQSRDPFEFVPALMAQANATLLRPVRPLQGELPYDAFPRLQSGGELSDYRPDNGTLRSPRVRHHLQAKLYETLECLVEERSYATLVIDALDEIAQIGDDLDFLPDILPSGSTIVLTCRPENRLLSVLSQRFRPKHLTLEGLDSEEIQSLTGVDDATWVNRVREQCRGAPLYVQDIATQIREGTNGYASVDLPSSMTAVFQRQLTRWRTAGVEEARDPLHLVLCLLSLLEPVAAVDIDLLQSFLERRGTPLSGRELRTRLDPIASQVEGLQTGKVKLAVKAFAEHVRESVLSKNDVRRLLADVTDWLACEHDADAALLATFACFWTDADCVKDARQREAVTELPGKLVANGRLKLLGQMHRHWTRRPRASQRVPAILQNGLEAAASHGDTDAMLDLALMHVMSQKQGWETMARTLFEKAAQGGNVFALSMMGNMYLDGLGGPRLVEAGAEALRTATAKGDDFGKTHLAQRLLDGRGLPCAPEEGERLLREAAHEYVLAKMHLAERLLDGRGVLRQRAEGERLLREAASLLVFAEQQLAERLLDGLGLTRDRARGEQHLRESAAKSSDAAWELASRLLEGRNMERAADEGERLLRNVAIELPSAKWELARRYLEGRGVRQNLETGREMLSDVAADLPAAKRDLAERYLDGRAVPRDRSRGEYLLREAAGIDSVAKLALAERLLDGAGLPRNAEEGERHLRDAAEADVVARRQLACRLMDARGLALDAINGLRILREAAAESPDAQLELARRLLDGRIPGGVDEGRMYFGELARKHVAVKLEMAQRHFEGSGFPSDPSAGRRLLEECALDSLPAKTELAMRHLDGRGIPQSVEHGEQLLREAAEASIEARLELAKRLLDGRRVCRAPLNGAELLRDAAAVSVDARLELARRCLGGAAYIGTLEEGEAFLREVAAVRPEVRIELAEHLIEKVATPTAKAQAASLLREESFASQNAKLVFARHCLDGNVEDGAALGERLLREAAVDDLAASRDLALRQLDGRGLPRAAKDGRRTLRSLAVRDNRAALELAVRTLDGRGVPQSRAQGVKQLKEVARKYAPAAIELVSRASSGEWPPADVREAESILRDAAIRDPQARLELAARCLYKRTSENCLQEGESLLAELLDGGKVTADSVGRVGSHAYEAALRASSPDRREACMGAASRAFRLAMVAGSADSANNLAYMLRRGEVPARECPPLDDLLRAGLAAKEPFPIINQSLREAMGVDCTKDWRSADTRVASLNRSDAEDIREWWHARATEECDPEGHLVLAWLARHKLMDVRHGERPQEWLTLAAKAYDVPPWFTFPSDT